MIRQWWRQFKHYRQTEHFKNRIFKVSLAGLLIYIAYQTFYFWSPHKTYGEKSIEAQEE